MAHLGLRIPNELHDQVKAVAQEQDISVSDYVRTAVEQVLHGVKSESNSVSQSLYKEQLAGKEREIEFLRQELTAVRQTLDESVKRHDTIVLSITQHLEQANLQLEDLRARHNRSWWQKLFGGA